MAHCRHEQLSYFATDAFSLSEMLSLWQRHRNVWLCVGVCYKRSHNHQVISSVNLSSR